MAANNQSYYPNSSTTPLICLTSIGHTTIWREQKVDLNKVRNSLYNPRAITNCDELDATYQKEHDMVVIILAVGRIVEKMMQNGIVMKIQPAIATDTSGQFVFIEFNKSFFINLNDLLIPRNILAITNLKHAGYNSNCGIHILFTCEETEIKQHPHKDHLNQ